MVITGGIVGLVAGIVTIVASAPSPWAKTVALIAGILLVAVLSVVILRSPKRQRVRAGLATIGGGLALVMLVVPFVETVLPVGATTCGTRSDGGSVSGSWGPDREMFTVHEPAPYPVLNSISDNPNIGDERDFFGVKLSTDAAGGWCQSVAAKDGVVLRFRIYVKNSALDGLGSKGAARGVAFQVTKSEERATLQTVAAFLTAENTKPNRIWSQVEASSDKPFRLDLVEGSTRVHSNAKQYDEASAGSGRKIDDAINAWQRLGYGKDDGVILPGYEYALYLVFEMRVTHVG